MYRALYRKWRPAVFADVVGQTGITTALQNQILHNKVGHAYIFTGTRGTGKTTCAKIFAKAVNCPHPHGADPCGTCAVCTGIDNGSVMDVVEIDAASNNGVDNIRDLRDESVYTPSECTYKVYIIDEVHMLSPAAFNALLKIMEEPPAHVIFILATTEIHKVPATVLSRCQRYDFTRLSLADIEGRLLYVAEQEHIALSQEAAGLIARLADGAMRDALSILDTCAGVDATVDAQTVRRMAGVTDQSYLFELSDAVAAKEPVAALALVAQLRERSVEVKRLCDELILHYRNILLAGVSGDGSLLMGVSAEDEARYREAAHTVSQTQAVRAIRTLCEALDKMGKSVDARIELELALFQLCGDEPKPTALPVSMAAPAAVQRSVNSGAPVPFAVSTSPAVAAPVGSAPAAVPPAAVSPIAASSAEADTPPWETSESPSAPSVLDALLKQAAPQPKQEPVAQPTATVSGGESVSAAPPLPDGLFSGWQQVVESIVQRDVSLAPFLKNTKAYIRGRYVLIEGSGLFLDFMRKNARSNHVIKDAIYETTGVHYNIGPYKKDGDAAQRQSTAEDTLAALAQRGVEVIYKNEP